jgi:hypothetical protein
MPSDKNWLQIAASHPTPPAPRTWLPDPFDAAGRFLDWLLLGAGWLLARLPSALVFTGYMLCAIWLTRWVARHVRPVLPDPNHPLVQQPGGVRVWNGILLVRTLAALVPTAIGVGIPLDLAQLWRDPYAWGAPDTLGMFGRLSMLVGGVCGFTIGAICQYQLIAFFVFGAIGYELWKLAGWIITG